MISPKIIYEDKDILVIDKPAGLMVHSDERAKEKTLVDWVLEKYPEIKGVGDDPELRPGIVHRLDKDTSGVLLIVKKQKAFKFFKKQFAAHALELKNEEQEGNVGEKIQGIKKRYIALVCGAVRDDKGVINRPIGKSAFDFRKKAAGGKMRGEERGAITEYRVLERLKDSGGSSYTLLEAFPRTGRTHQIRVHLRAIGHPVARDSLYGFKQACPVWLSRMFLHAASLEITMLSGERKKFEAELPADLEKALKFAKKTALC